VIIISNLWILTRCIWVEFSNRLSNINDEHDKFGSHDSHSRHVVWTAINVHLMHVCFKSRLSIADMFTRLNCLAIQLTISQNPTSLTSNIRPVSQNIVIRILTRFKIYEISLLYQILLVNNWNCNATEQWTQFQTRWHLMSRPTWLDSSRKLHLPTIFRAVWLLVNNSLTKSGIRKSLQMVVP